MTHSLVGQTTEDTTFIESYRNNVTYRVFGKSNYNRLIQESNLTNNQIRFRANNALKFGVGLNYKWFGLNVSLLSPFKRIDQRRKGETTGFDFQTNLYLKEVTVDVHLQSTQGYFLNNRSLMTNNQFLQRPDLQSFSLGGDFLYVFNHNKFSFRAPFLQTEKQLKTAGSWLIGFKTGVFSVQADSVWVPYQLDEFLSQDSSLQSISSFNLGLTGGYAYTYVFPNDFFITLSGTPTLSVQISDYQYPIALNNSVESNLYLKLQIRGAAGKNTPKMFYGLTFVNDNITMGADKDYRYTFVFGNLRFIYARRI